MTYPPTIRTIDLGEIQVWHNPEEDGPALTDSQFFWFHETMVSKVTKYYTKIYSEVYEDAQRVAEEW